MGGEGKGSGNGTPQPAAHLPFFSPLAAHHSAKRGSVERNLPIYDLKSKVLRLKSNVFILHSHRLIPSALLAAGVLDETLLLEVQEATIHCSLGKRGVFDDFFGLTSRMCLDIVDNSIKFVFRWSRQAFFIFFWYVGQSFPYWL